nr:dynein intermediate chain 2, ciliary-like [Cherax quadricarinatus]
MLTIVAIQAEIKQLDQFNMNFFHDLIPTDFKYWEDTSDDFRPLEGSLLPLWKFTSYKTRDLMVADISWSPTYPDLLAAAYTPGEMSGPDEAGGLLCLYTLKNPGVPERYLPTPCGLTSVQFHPTHESVLVAGRTDGAVMVYDARQALLPRVVTSSTTSGKHLLPVCQVKWVPTEPGQNLSFYSVGDDGRVSEWTVRPSALDVTDLLDFKTHAITTSFKGIATCVSFKPVDKSILLVGLDTGVVLEMCLTASSHPYILYTAHKAPIRAIVWNSHHHQLFATCSLDWMLKIWMQHYTCALVTLDLGAPMSGLTWCNYSSSVIVGVTEDGRVHVYDLFLHKCRPLCVQNLLQRRRSSVACLELSPFFPILLVGGDRGYLVTFKLSPNLRRPHKEAKGADEQKLREIELAKMERIITTAKISAKTHFH